MKLRSRVTLFALAVLVTTAIPASASAFGPTLEFSSFGTDAGKLNGPGEAVGAPDGSVYVSDFSNRRIDVFSPAGAFQFAFGKDVAADGSEADVCTAISGCQVGKGTPEAGAEGSPEGLEIADGKLYVANIGANRIDVFTLDGLFLFGFGSGVNAQVGTQEPNVCTAASGCQNGLGDGSAGAIKQPQGVGVGPDGNVYVADRGNNRIDVFTSQGTFEFAFGGGVSSDGTNVCSPAGGCKAGSEGTGVAGEITRPFDVKAGPGGLIFVSDRGNKRIDVYTTAGAFQRAFAKGVNPLDESGVCRVECRVGDAGAGAGAVIPAALEVDGAGNVYIADGNNNRIAEFAADGQFQQAFGEGVLDGTEAFQVCTTASGCQGGKMHGTIAGAAASAFGVAIDCKQGIYAVEEFGEFARVERFAEPNPVVCPQPEGEKPGSEKPGSEKPAGEKPGENEKPSGEKPSNQFAFGHLRLNRERGTATLAVTLPGPGTVVLRGKGIAAARAVARRAGVVRLTIRPVGSARRRLLKAARVAVKASVTFTPTGGAPLTRQHSVTLRAALGR